MDRPTILDETHQRIRAFWDEDARVYDRSTSHAATDPVEAAAWRAALLRHLPPPPARVLDAGAGTGSISLLAAGLGYEVTALDLSSAMLAEAARKAERQGLHIDTVVAPATQPPPGPFDAVVERHLLWTTPDPVAALRAWAGVAGRVVLFEGMWHVGGTLGRVRERATEMMRRALGVPHDHHAHYEPDLYASLPLAPMSAAKLLAALSEAGYTRARVERLRDVEWARRLSGPNLVLGHLESRPQFVMVAEPAGA